MLPNQLVVPNQNFGLELTSEMSFLGSRVLKSTPHTLWVHGDSREPAWADCVWRDVKALEIASIGDAQKKLRAISPAWRYYGDLLHRRGALIAEKLGSPKSGPVSFPSLIEGANLPAFTMADANLIFYSEKVGRPTADGKIPFIENRTVPPSRAYLKLWEAFTVLGHWPQPGEQVMDLGSSPGSWTWALAELQANVMSIDRSPLADQVAASPLVTTRQGDAFGVAPTAMDWVFSDVICYPEKLFDYLQKWLESGHCEKFICNVKFSGEVDPRIVDRFRQLPHSRILHMLNGKKEVTWIRHPSIAL